MERSVRAILRAETGQYEAGMGRAAKATEAVGTAAQGAARQTEQSAQQQTTAARTFSQRLTQSARENEQAWTQVGGALAIVGGATSGLMAVVANTGISYNSLRQTATQGLTAVTGSTEEATAQMRRLDEYGQNSWLMRDSLIRAQQNMSGFGIETEKVIPYMDALAEGVAAAGGSNQDFEELAQVMGKVNSSGKLTAETFNEFGNRGIDAAQMIGDAMGKTAGQVRDDVTSGALDAGDALDALAEGLVMNFEGSSDLVRNTFQGASADVQAAFRDIAAIAMAPLVDPEGGGLLTSLMGQVADLLFALRDLPDPILQIGGMLTGLGGLATLAAGGFLLLAPRALETWDALGKMGEVGLRAQDVLRRLARRAGPAAVAIGKTAAAIGLATVAMRGLNETSESTTGGVEQVRRHLMDLGDAGNDISTLFSDIELGWLATPIGSENSVVRDLEDFQHQLKRMTDEDLLGKLERGIGNLTGSWDDSLQGQFEERIGAVNDILTDLVSSGNIDEAAEQFSNLSMAAGGTDQAAIDLINSMPEFRDSLVGVANDAGLATDDATLLKIALGFIGPEAEAAAEGTGLLSGAQDEMTAEFDAATSAMEAQEEALRALIDATNAHYDTILNERSALRNLEAAFDTATDSIDEHGATLDITTEAGRANEAALDDIAVSAHAVTDEMRDMNRPTAEIADAMDRAREEFINTATAMGMAEDDAAALATELGLLPREVFIDVEANMNAEAQISTFRERWDGVNIATAWVDIRARDNLTAGQAASGARYTAQARSYFGGYTGGPVMDPSHRRIEYRAYGGPVAGGDGTRDSVPAVGPGGVRYQLDHGEHIWTKAETAAVGGHGAMYELRSLAKAGRLQAALGMYEGGSVSHRPYATAPTVIAQQARAGGSTTLSLAGMTVAVRVGERQFTGYVEDVADGRIDENNRLERSW